MTDTERLGMLLAAATWITARRGDHQYTLRRTWTNDGDFAWAVAFIRSHGYWATFAGRSYVYVDVGGHSYWSMGAPVADTILINRAR
jgi:hypothetical protein